MGGQVVDRRKCAIVMGLVMVLGANLAATETSSGAQGGSGPLSGPSLGFAGGDGSPSNPFQVSNVTELQNMSANVSAHYELVSDIDASATSGWNGGAGFAPVGSAALKFNGSLDGNGHTISGLTIDRPGQDYIGLFGYMEGAVVRDLEMAGTSVVGRNRVGALCGQSASGDVANCTVSGSVAGTDYIGGLAGVLSGALNDSSASASVSGRQYVGGLAGYTSGAVARCASHKTVSFTQYYAGGLVGSIAGGTVSDSRSDADVSFTGSSSASRAGGLAGNSAGAVTSCRSEGDVNIAVEGYYSEMVGGLLGRNQGSVSYCRSTGTVVCIQSSQLDFFLSSVGGFTGHNSGTVTYSSAHSLVLVMGSTVGYGPMTQISEIGGFAGRNDGTITSCFSTGSCTAFGSSDFWFDVYSVGGLCGSNGGTVSDCFATGNVRGVATATYTRVNRCGGLVGSAEGRRTVTHCYSTGEVSASAQGRYASVDYIGGLLGYATVAATACFWDIETSGTTTGVGSGPTAGTSGNTTAEMMTRATFTESGWDFNDTWLMIENVTYPLLFGVYHRPSVDIEDGLAFEEDAPLVLPVDVTVSAYPDANREESVAFASSAGPWLEWNATLRAFTGTPSNEDVGTYWLNFTAEDRCGHAGWTNVTFSVANVNDDPVITTPDVTVATEDAIYSVDYEAEDVDPTGDVLTWNVSTTAEWLEMNATTGLLTGTPENDHVGAHLVTVKVADGNGGEDATTFMLVVGNTNDDPVIATTDVTTAVEDEMYSVRYRATDEDPTSDALTWHLDTDAPWLSMTGDHLSGVPGNDHVGAFRVNVTVTDGNGGEASSEFTLTVTNVNDAPVVTTEGLDPAIEDQAYTAPCEADDIDPTSDELTWTLEAGPAWLSIDPATGVLSGTPTNDDVGAHQVTVRVSDGRGGEDVGSFTLTVSNVNDDPVIVTTPQGTVRQGDAYAVLLAATDEDPTEDAFEWSLETDAGWLRLDGSLLRGVPANDDVGDVQVTVTVSDGRGGTDTLAFTLTVLNANDPPVIVSTPPGAVEDAPYSFAMEGRDPDAGDALTWTLAPAGGWLSIDPATGELSGTPTNDDVGSHLVMVTVSDGTLSSSRGFTITVANTDDAPEWATPPTDVTIEEGTPLALTVRAWDADGDAVSYALACEPAAEGLFIGPVSGEVTWYETRPGTYRLTLTATSGGKEVAHALNLTVTKAPAEEEEGAGTAPLWAVILVLAVLVVVLLFRQLARGGGAPAPAPAPRDDAGARAEGDMGDTEEEAGANEPHVPGQQPEKP